MDGGAALERVTSRDGTSIAYRRSGTGPPVVLVHGTAGAHWSWRFIAPVLATDFTVCALDRRGRGESADAGDYAIEREFEDVAAVVDSLGEPAAVFGHSYGATVAFGAALLTGNLTKVVAYEPSPGIEAVAPPELDRIDALVGEGEPEAALVLALRVFGLTDEELEALQASPTWPERVAGVHTIVREVRAEAASGLAALHLGDLTQPVLLLLGEESPDWAAQGTEAIRAALPDATVVLLAGEGHAATMTAPELVAAEVAGFLSE